MTFSEQGLTALDIAAGLREQGINTSATSLESARFDFEARGLTEMVRVSPHYYNTLDELDRLRTRVDSCE